MHIYPENFEEKIDFDTVRACIIAKCLSPLGEEKVAEMAFATEYEIVDQWLDQTSEFLKIVRNKEDFPTDYFLDIRAILKQIDERTSAWLSEKEIPLLANSLETIVRIVNFLNERHKDEAREYTYPELKKMADEITLFPVIIEKANHILDKSGQIKDNASKLLANIRRHKIEAAKDITRNMQVALRNAQAQGAIGKDVQADMRGGHYLIPVAATNKRKTKGVVRDTSGSGKTYFIEPESVVEAADRLRELENEERKELVRILTEFTDILRPDIPAMLAAYDFMGKIDFIRAKALFALRIKGIKPAFENKQHIAWIGAVHPLLDMTLRQQNGAAQPLDIRLTPKDRILIVSGVNAGGKSLCLKTVALLQYMLQCGLLIPVQANSQAGIFKSIFMDIGDGQSFENSLSTYTSHLTNMKFFVENNDDKTLLLIDEFGGGTEPQIGGAIAETLLDRFNKRKSFGLITTHFQNLKHFAYNTEGIINGAMLYDSENDRPMYKLSIGNPGSSFAFEVARRVGLSECIVADASQKIGKDFVQMDVLLQFIARDKLYWETKRRELDTYAKKREAGEVELERPSMKVGDRVRLKGQTAVGTILQITGQQATVAFGTNKSKVKLNCLVLERG